MKDPIQVVSLLLVSSKNPPKKNNYFEKRPRLLSRFLSVSPHRTPGESEAAAHQRRCQVYSAAAPRFSSQPSMADPAWPSGLRYRSDLVVIEVNKTTNNKQKNWCWIAISSSCGEKAKQRPVTRFPFGQVAYPCNAGVILRRSLRWLGPAAGLIKWVCPCDSTRIRVPTTGWTVLGMWGWVLEGVLVSLTS